MVSKKFGWLAASLLAVVAMVLTVGGGLARAEGVLINDAPDVGGYRISVFALPNPITVGKVSMLIRLARPTATGQESPVRGARMVVEFYPISGPGASSTSSYVQRQNLVAEESEPGTYQLADSLQNEGTYRVTLDIEDAGKKTRHIFELVARPQPDDRFFSVILLALVPILLAWLVWLYLKRPGKSTDAPTGAAEESLEEASR